MVDTRRMYESDYVCKEAIEDMDDPESREFVILDAGKPVLFDSNERMELTVQFIKTKAIKKWRMNKSSWRAWKKKHGYDSDEWVGKKGIFSIEIHEKNKKEMIYGSPTD